MNTPLTFEAWLASRDGHQTLQMAALRFLSLADALRLAFDAGVQAATAALPPKVK